jgi:hypothetical protein
MIEAVWTASGVLQTTVGVDASEAAPPIERPPLSFLNDHCRSRSSMATASLNTLRFSRPRSISGAVFDRKLAQDRRSARISSRCRVKVSKLAGG